MSAKDVSDRGRVVAAWRRRPVSIVGTVGGLVLAVTSAAAIWSSLPHARQNLALAEAARDAIPDESQNVAADVLQALQATGERHVADAELVLAGWERLGWVAAVLAVLAVVILAGLVAERVRRVAPVTPVAVLSAGVLGLFGQVAVPSDGDAGFTQLAVVMFGVAVLCLSFSGALDTAMTARERHAELLAAVRAENGSRTRSTSTRPTRR